MYTILTFLGTEGERERERERESNKHINKMYAYARQQRWQ